MNLRQSIFLFFALTPYNLVSQNFHPGGMDYAKKLNENWESLAKKVYFLGSQAHLYKNPDCTDTFPPSMYKEISTCNEIIIQVPDPIYPEDDFARIDTVVHFPFELKQIKNLCFYYLGEELYSISPLRYFDQQQFEPLFCVKWADLKPLLSDLEANLIFSMSNSNSGLIQAMPFFVEEVYHLEKPTHLIINSISDCFKNLYHIHQNKELLFQDSLFTSPHLGKLKVDSIEPHSSVFRDPVVNDTFYKLDMVVKKDFVNFAFMYEYTEKDPEYPNDSFASISWTVVEHLYCRKENLENQCPAWLRHLIKYAAINEN